MDHAGVESYAALSSASPVIEPFICVQGVALGKKESCAASFGPHGLRGASVIRLLGECTQFDRF
jgi:hypothetical protein